MPRHRCLELGKRRVGIKLGSSRRRADVVLDLCCGTATSASKYYLLNNKNAIVIGIDRFKTKSWVEGHLKDLPRQARDRFFFFREDMATLDVTRLSQLIRQCCRSARVSHMTRVGLNMKQRHKATPAWYSGLECSPTRIRRNRDLGGKTCGQGLSLN